MSKSIVTDPAHEEADKAAGASRQSAAARARSTYGDDNGEHCGDWSLVSYLANPRCDEHCAMNLTRRLIPFTCCGDLSEPPAKIVS